MALSGSFTGAAGTSNPGVNYQLRVDWSASQDYVNNTSTITCTFYLVQNPSWSISIGGRSNTCTIDGVAIAWTSPTVSNGGGTTTQIGSCSRVVSHNPDGSKSLNITAVYSTYPLTISGVSIAEIRASASITLDSIPRTSVPTVSTSSVAMRDGSVTIYTNRASSVFTHKLHYVCGSTSGPIANDVADKYEWTPPLDLAYQAPNDDKVSVTIYCDTYSNGSLVGTQPIGIVATIPANVTPYAEILNRGDATAAYVTLGTYVQNMSRLNLHIGSSGTYGSWVTGVGITLGGKAFSSGGLITGSGNLTLRITVTDSRGRSNYDEEIISVAPYKEPQLTLTAHRCDDDGTANDAGEYAKITVSGSTTQVNNRNTATCMLTYGSTTVNLGIGIGDFSKERIVAVSSEQTMAIFATLSDALKSVPRSMVLSTGFATMDFLAGGRGIAFGATATKEGFTCAMPARFKKIEQIENLADLVYPVGAIYMSLVSTSPAELFGGTWEQICGRFLLGVGDNGDGNYYTPNASGGEASHTLTIDEMPSHHHEIPYTPLAVADQGWNWGNENLRGAGASHWTKERGGDQPHNNMPPYLAVYMWKRIA